MAEKIWHTLDEMIQLTLTNSDDVVIDYLAGAVAELNLPPSLIEQIQTSVTTAIRRAWEHDVERVVHLTVAALALQAGAGHRGHSWGFFLIEKRLENTADRRIDVLLYPEEA